MVASTTVGPAAASTSTPQRAFDTSHDFIAFDLTEDAGDGDEDQDDESKEPLAMDRGEGSSRGGTVAASRRRGASPVGDFGSAGRKRKIDDRRQESSRTKKDKQKAAARGTPWCADVDWDRCRNPAEALHRELAAFERWLSPTREEDETRRMVIQLIRNAITGQFKDAKVYSFGSQDTQLYLPQGDIDLVVVSSSMERQRRESVLRAMAALLRRANLATNVTVIAKAKVPIIKFVCTYGKYHVDISVNQTNGLQAAEFVKGFLRRQPALRPLIMATKVLLSQRGMSEVYSGGLGSYSVICMCISHLQLHPKIQRGEIDPSRNLGVLFLELLELYGKNFGYDRTAISIRGQGGYFDKTTRGWADPRRPFMLCIEDPQDPSNDISKGSFQITAVRTVFAGSYDILTAAMCERALEGSSSRGRGGGSNGAHQRFDEDREAREALLGEAGAAGTRVADRDPQSFLGLIFGISRETIKARKDILELYDSGTLQFKLGGPIPPRSPPPAPSASHLKGSRPSSSSKNSRAPSEQRALPPTPKAPRADRERAAAAAAAAAGGRMGNGITSQRDGAPASTATATTSKGVSASAPQGTKGRPILIVDDSTSDDGPMRRSPRRVVAANDGSGEAGEREREKSKTSTFFVVEDDSDSDGPDSGSRYTAMATASGTSLSRPAGKRMRKSLQGEVGITARYAHDGEEESDEGGEESDLEGAAEGHFMSAASVSSDEDEEDHEEDGIQVSPPTSATPIKRPRDRPSASARARANASAAKLSTKDRLAFWTSKGNAEDEDEDEDEEDGKGLKIYD